MRTSTYEIILPLIGTDERETDGKALLFNGLYGAMDVADRETADILRKGDLSSLTRMPDETGGVRENIIQKAKGMASGPEAIPFTSIDFPDQFKNRPVVRFLRPGSFPVRLP